MTYGKTTCQIFTEDDTTISLILVTQLFAEFGKVRILKFFCRQNESSDDIYAAMTEYNLLLI